MAIPCYSTASDAVAVAAAAAAVVDSPAKARVPQTQSLRGSAFSHILPDFVNGVYDVIGLHSL